MKHFLVVALSLASLFSAPALALEGLYVGGQVGHVALQGDVATQANNAIGFGADLGFRTAGLLDLVFGIQRSSHGGSADLSLLSTTLTADVHVGRVQDFDFTLGAGPGFYFFNTVSASATKFGLQFGGAADVLVDDSLRVGLGMKYHAVFSGDASSGSYWTIMMRFGYLFNLNG